MSSFVHRDDLYLENLKSLISEDVSINEHECIPGLCGVDSFVLISWLKSIGAKKVVEFGCGTTTRRMIAAGIEVTSFSKGLPGNLKGETGINYIQCDLFNMDKEEILSHINNADAMVIDCEHSEKFARYYHENFLMKTDIPVWIHDVFNFKTFNKYIYGEAEYLYEHVFNKTHEIFVMTDIPSKLAELTELVGTDVKMHQGRRIAKLPMSIRSPVSNIDKQHTEAELKKPKSWAEAHRRTLARRKRLKRPRFPVLNHRLINVARPIVCSVIINRIKEE